MNTAPSAGSNGTASTADTSAPVDSAVIRTSTRSAPARSRPAQAVDQQLRIGGELDLSPVTWLEAVLADLRAARAQSVHR